MPDALLRALARLLLLAGLLAAGPARAQAPDVLPVDDAFALTARATPAGIEVRWAIADGYYLYRHRTAVAADAGFAAEALQLPPGKPHRDEFFGDVETYRGELVATLPGTARAARTQLTVKYQGCADTGICYPPQTRQLAVVLAARADPFARGPGGLRSGLQLGNDALPLPAEQAFGVEAIARDGNTLLVRFTPAPGYYLYRDRTTFALDAASSARGLALAAPRWPPARAHRDEHFGAVQVYFDAVDVPLPVRRRDGDAMPLALKVAFQGCQDGGVCYPPMTRLLEVALPAGAATVAAAVPAPLPAARPGATVASPAPGVPRAADAQPVEVPRSTPPPAARMPLLLALLLALLGGLVLNLMPCVLPVLSLKALSLANAGAGARGRALAYTAGVLATMLALGGMAIALRNAGLALGWGFQLQQPLVVAALALLMFALGLNLSGAWQLGGRWLGVGQGLAARGGHAGDFFTGVLAVVVATPCTAPFMGAALAWAFLAPAPAALAVFVALGLGLALPFLLIAWLPALASRLPRPGAWMETLRQGLAFPLYLTSAWLLWVLGRQRGSDAVVATLVALVAIAFLAWAASRGRALRLLGAIALVAGLGFGVVSVHRAAPRSEAAQAAFSTARVEALRAAGQPVFVNITADWCVTCKANERAVLSRSAFKDALARTGTAYLEGDWTDVDPAITAFLQSHGAVGVPLYVVYPRNGGTPRVLPTVLTPRLVEEALTEASR